MCENKKRFYSIFVQIHPAIEFDENRTEKTLSIADSRNLSPHSNPKNAVRPIENGTDGIQLFPLSFII